MNHSWLQVISLFLANVGLILWFRSESRQDWRLMDSKHESFRAEMSLMLKGIHDEIKDFHGRLCVIDEKHKNLDKKK